MIVPRQGSSEITSSHEKPVKLRPEIIDKKPVLDAQAILDEEVVQNSLTAHTSFNEDSYQRMANTLAGYPEGRIIKVTYFSQNTPITDIRSKVVDLMAWTKDDVHIAWTEIRHFEIRASREIDFSYDEGTNNSKITGEGLVFPGFNPNVGDIFLYRIRNGKIGIFYVSNMSRLALGQETYHRIEFTLQAYLTPEFRDRLARQATAVFYFDKQKFLTGNYAFMSTEGYIQQKELKHLRKEIIQNYVDRFYSKDMSSFIRPDGIYDPYAVEYWNKKISVVDCYQRPLQLLISLQNFKKTIWAAMTNNPIKDLRNLARNWSIEESVATFWSINVTSLLGHKFLTVGNEEGAVPPPTTHWGENYAVPANSTGMEFTQTEHEKLRELSDETMKENRRKFYHDFLPFRMCAPHQHPANFHVCNPANCEECDTDPLGGHHKIKRNKPPFPILSDSDLEFIWRRLRGYSKDLILDEAQRAEVRGYIVWYRTIYPGTLSRVELEKEWREKSGIPPTQELTEAEEAGLIEYIKSYRSKFAPVLKDRELEVIWRTQLRLSYDLTLSKDQLVELALYISQYRDLHGFPPKDGYEIPDLVLGGRITVDELRAAGAVIYSDNVMLSMDATELIQALEARIPPADKEDPIPPDYVPTVYYPRYPKPWHHVHCHDICHELCQKAPNKTSSSKTSVVSDSYGLSSSFYEGSAAMSPFEQILYDVITNKDINPGRILSVVETYLDWDDESAFYMELCAIYLIDKALYWLRYHS